MEVLVQWSHRSTEGPVPCVSLPEPPSLKAPLLGPAQPHPSPRWRGEAVAVLESAQQPEPVPGQHCGSDGSEELDPGSEGQPLGSGSVERG